jgi:hypothetical protein
MDEWHSWSLSGVMVSFLNGKVNYYGMGTAMHEILHKQAVGGGFSHDQMDTAIKAVGSPPLTGGHNADSDGIGKLCFANLQ